MAKPIESDWEDITPSGDPDWEDVTTQPEMGIWDSIKTIAGHASDQFGQTPIGFLADKANLIQSGADVLGERTAETLAGPGMAPQNTGLPFPANVVLGSAKNNQPSLHTNPYIAALAGTVVQNSPAALFPPTESLPYTPPEMAQGMARRSMGFQKSLLKTPFARGQAQKSGEMALQENIIPWSGNPQTALDRASTLANESGSRIGKVLKDVPADLDSAMANLEVARVQLTKGFTGGLFEKASNTVDAVKSNLQELYNRTKGSFGLQPKAGEEISTNSINQIKTRLARSINYLADLAAQSDNKVVVNNLANSIRDSVKAILPKEGYLNFIKDQKLFNMAELMKKGLNNEVAGQMGNRAVSPYSTIVATGELAAGHPAAAAATLGLTEAAMRRGSGSGAKALDTISRGAYNLQPGVIPSMSRLGLITKESSKKK